MVVYDEYENGYKLFDPSYHKTFIERSVQFKEDPMQEVELVEGDCWHPPLNDDVSDVSIYYFSDSNMEDEDNEIHAYHDSLTRTKWDEKTIQ